MAKKVDRINVSYTGSAAGLSAASDQASKKLRAVQAQAERTKKRLSEIKQSANQAAEGLAKFGIGGGAAGMLGGAAGLAAMGPAGLALAGGGVAFAAASAGVRTVLEAVRSLPDERKKAVEALKLVARDDRNTFAQFGFTEELARRLAESQKAPVAAGGMGFQRGFTLGFGGQNTPQQRLLSTLVNEAPGALGIVAGSVAGGASVQEGQRLAAPAVFGDTPGQQMGNVLGMASDAMSMWNSIQNWWSR